ncbi:MAG: 30S ribosomal protein S4 [Bdellovibrionales bacterium]|nr:30S ribosomal protein S4 [Bdellovibrionales bacterium]MCB0332343.1 30S ribosomal protein S4 [Bdellovibrionales bacterium]
MAKYIGPVCRMCRREGEKLFLKGERCYTSKCSVERREGGPGQHGKGRQQFSDYKVQLRAKQKVRRSYGILEKKFRDYFKVAAKSKGVTGTELLVQLETRLDNIVYRLGFGTSRAHARQVVNHGHMRVNGKRVNIPSYRVKVGDVVEVSDKARSDLSIGAAVSLGESRSIPEWLTLDREQFRGTVVALPNREQIPRSYQEQLIVELYSK